MSYDEFAVFEGVRVYCLESEIGEGEMDNEKKPSMNKLDPPERSRTYVYKSGHRHTLENVVAVGNEQGWDRIQTADGKLHTVLTVIKKGDLVVDYCISRELDTDAWTF